MLEATRFCEKFTPASPSPGVPDLKSTEVTRSCVRKEENPAGRLVVSNTLPDSRFVTDSVFRRIEHPLRSEAKSKSIQGLHEFRRVDRIETEADRVDDTECNFSVAFLLAADCGTLPLFR